MVKGYIKNWELKTEAIEAFIFPSSEFSKGKDAAEIEARLNEIIAEVNRALLPYKRISRISILGEALEMSSTRKIKRFKVK